MKEDLINSLIGHAHGEIAYHKANVNFYLNNPVGIGEHHDVMGAITSELHEVAKWQDVLDVLEGYRK